LRKRAFFYGFLIFLLILAVLVYLYNATNLRPLSSGWVISDVESEKNERLKEHIGNEISFPFSAYLEEGESVIIQRDVSLSNEETVVAFPIAPFAEKGSIHFDSTVIGDISRVKNQKEKTTPNVFLTYLIPKDYHGREGALKIEINGPSEGVVIYYPPMLGNPNLIRTATFKVFFVEMYMYLIATGVQIFIAFIMFQLGSHIKKRSKAYKYLSLGILMGTVIIFSHIVFFHYPALNDRLIYQYLEFFLYLMSFVFLFYGLELLVRNKGAISRYYFYISAGILLFILMPFLPLVLKAIVLQVFILIVVLTMMYITNKSRLVPNIFQTVVAVLFFCMLYDAFFRESFIQFPLPSMLSYGLIEFSLALGLIFVNDFVKVYDKERRTRENLSATTEEMHAVNEELEASYQEIEKLNTSLEVKVIERTQELNTSLMDMKMILDNIAEGLLTLDKSQRVEPNYSAQCERIFGQEIHGEAFPALVFGEGREDQREFLEKTISAIQLEKNPLRLEAYLSLLPQQLYLNGMYIRADYKWIDDPVPGDMQLLVILRDVTERKELENRVMKERNNLSKIVKVLVNLEEFKRIIDDYRNFCFEEVGNIVEGNEDIQLMGSILKRRIHTFKGSFACFGLDFIENKLHELENELGALIDECTLQEEFCDEISRLLDPNRMLQWLRKELMRIKEQIGEDPIENTNTIKIQPQQLDKLKMRLKKALPEAYYTRVDQELEFLKKRNLKKVLAYYKFVVENISEKLGKPVNELEIKGDDVKVNPERYVKWVDSLVHLFRNSVDHGIEDTDERILNGKPDKGQIAIGIDNTGDGFTVTISDDGRGIDFELLKNKALEKGLITRESLKEMNADDIRNLIFLEGFSTKDTTNLLSGRGVGLASVRAEWEKLGGELDIDSEPGQGTAFIFRMRKRMHD